VDIANMVACSVSLETVRVFHDPPLLPQHRAK
jgi:hypothetical protein